MATRDRILNLEFEIEKFTLENLEHRVSPEWLRKTTVVHLHGAGATGSGEDPVYSEKDQVEFQEWGGKLLALKGRYTLASFSIMLTRLPVWPAPPQYPGSAQYRYWALESAALDLALRQNDLNLAGALKLEPKPVNFVVSRNLTDPVDLDSVHTILQHHPGLGLKLDAGPDWTDDVVKELAATKAVRVVDFKGAYVGTPVDQAPDAALYRRVAEGLPDALLEDPALTPQTRDVLSTQMHRVTWDAPIHSVDDIKALEHKPKQINIKPSRLGSIGALLDAYDYCDGEGIAMYGGGQFELGLGRGHIQYMASLFHPTGGNDVAPGTYNTAKSVAELPDSPLEPKLSPKGFSWEV
jgi:hypothetical protein